VNGDGVSADASGFLQLDSSRGVLDVLWVADDLNYSVGFVSKIRTTAFSGAPTYREVARYVSVTCFSDPINGSTEGVVLGQIPPATLCADGVTGCCSRDEVVPGPNGGHQPVQLIANRPSRIAVDWNGDAWVSNRAHWWGAQFNRASVTKIANNLSDCIDRNQNGQIDTSHDANGDGVINTDCNNDNVPDDFNAGCPVGVTKEFFGLDDECILFTTNTLPGGVGRPIALGPSRDQGPLTPSDVWAGMFASGTFYRIDGRTGQIVETVDMPGTNPYGAIVDNFGILWAPQAGGTALYYFDTNDPTQTGTVNYPGGTFYGISIDGYTEPDPITNEPVLIQQIWLGMMSGTCAARYRPVRDQGFAGLANGTWATGCITGAPAQGRGIAADNRSPTAYAWLALDGYASATTGHIGRIPIDIPDSTTTNLPVTNAFDTGQFGIVGVALSLDGSVWGVAQQSSSVVRLTVDATGTVTLPPDVLNLDDQPAKVENFCGQANCKPHPYSYSDFSGFTLRNFTNPKGFYTWIEQSACPPDTTNYLHVTWQADVPAGTTVTMRARGASSVADLDSASWTDPYTSSPADLHGPPGPLSPNPTSVLQIVFEMTAAFGTSPKLQAFQIVYQCE
jgi:hypothetical protein